MANMRLLTALLLVIAITSTLAGPSGASEEFGGRDRRSAPAQSSKKTAANGSAKTNGKSSKTVQKNSGKAPKKVVEKQTHVMPVFTRPNFLPCEAINSKLLDRCCRTPSSEFFTEGQLLTSNRQRRNVALFDSITEYRMNTLHRFRSDFLVDLRDPNIVRRFAEEACLLDALFKEYQYVTTGGDIDYTVTKNFFLSTSSKLWRPITANVVDECQKVITALQEKNVLNQRAMNRQKPNETCSIVPYVFIECVRRNLTLSCPEAQFTKQVPICVKQMEALRRCDVFSAALEALTATTKAPAIAKIEASSSSTTNSYTSTTTMSSSTMYSSSTSSSTGEPSSSTSSTTSTASSTTSTTTVASG